MIEFDILFETEETQRKRDLGMDYSMAECTIRPMTFIAMDSFAPFIDGEDHYTAIFSGGEIHICILSYDEFKEMIQKKLNIIIIDAKIPVEIPKAT